MTAEGKSVLSVPPVSVTFSVKLLNLKFWIVISSTLKLDVSTTSENVRESSPALISRV